MKLYGGASGARTGGRAATAKTGGKQKKKRSRLKILAIVLAVVLVLEGLYFTAVYSKNAFITKWRNAYITPAMETMSHQWLATAFIPADVIHEVMYAKVASQEAQAGLESQWKKEEPPAAEPETSGEHQEVEMTVVEQREPEIVAEEQFYELFHEVDAESMKAYLAAHPEALENGWNNLCINEAGLDDNGTDIQTIYGEQVLAIDVPNRILLIRVKGSGYQGILAVGKDPGRLSLRPSSQLGTVGETVAQIAAANNGVLAMNGSGYMDDNGGGDGSQLAGYAMCDGVSYGYSYVAKGEKRLELHEDDLMYICDTSAPVSSDCTDAVEWHPAMVVDGKDVVGIGWDGIQPRACIGQSDRYEVLMLVIEGRQPMRSMGITLYDCVDILLLHGCMQAMNLDGGTSAMMWYKGESIISCSNENKRPDGRELPTALVYGPAEP